MAQIAGQVITVDWEDVFPRNITFMRTHVLINPRQPLLAGCYLRRDYGVLTWIEFRYETGREVCTSCGIIGHSPPDCPHEDSDIERMMNEQMQLISERFGYETRYDPQHILFTNNIRAFCNWETRRSRNQNRDEGYIVREEPAERVMAQFQVVQQMQEELPLSPFPEEGQSPESLINSEIGDRVTQVHQSGGGGSQQAEHVRHVAHERCQEMVDHNQSEGHHSVNPHMPYFTPGQFHPELTKKPTCKVYCKADPNLLLTTRDGKVILAPANPSDEFQHWYKDEKFSSRVKDEAGFPSFALVNKVTGQAVKHSIEASFPVELIPYKADDVDELILWSESML